MMREELTKREKQIIKLMAKGMTSEEIGEKLKISKRTVEHTLLNARRIMDAKNSVHLYHIYLTKEGLL